MPEVLHLLVETVGPLHLGCDEVYEPYNSVFRSEEKCLVAFDFYDFFEQLPQNEQNRFLEICRKGTIGSILEIYKFMARQQHLARGLKIPVPFSLLQRHSAILQLKERQFAQELNKFLIRRTAYLSSDQRPYIPGTAIKGALRTAYLNYLAEKAAEVAPVNLPQDKREDGRYLETQLLEGSFQTDPFRLVKVSDFRPVGEIKTKIIYAVNLKKAGGRGRGPHQILEVVEPGSWFQGTITIEDWPESFRKVARILENQSRQQKRAEIRRPIKASVLWQSILKFYAQEREREEKELFELGLPKLDWPTAGEAVPCRLGFHSGAECLTIAGYRRIKIKTTGGKVEKKPFATTLWLAAPAPDNWPPQSPRPFGWVSLRPLTAELEAKIQHREEEWRKTRKATELSPSPAVAPERGESATEPPPSSPRPASAEETWERANLTYNPGKQELTATFGGKKASAKGLNLVPAELQGKLKKKGLQARVVVEKFGNAWQLIRIEDAK